MATRRITIWKTSLKSNSESQWITDIRLFEELDLHALIQCGSICEGRAALPIRAPKLAAPGIRICSTFLAHRQLLSYYSRSTSGTVHLSSMRELGHATGSFGIRMKSSNVPQRWEFSLRYRNTGSEAFSWDRFLWRGYQKLSEASRRFSLELYSVQNHIYITMTDPFLLLDERKLWMPKPACTPR